MLKAGVVFVRVDLAGRAPVVVVERGRVCCVSGKDDGSRTRTRTRTTTSGLYPKPKSRTAGRGGGSAPCAWLSPSSPGRAGRGSGHRPAVSWLNVYMCWMDEPPFCRLRTQAGERRKGRDGTYVAGVRRPAEVLLVLELGAERPREALEPELGRLSFLYLNRVVGQFVTHTSLVCRYVHNIIAHVPSAAAGLSPPSARPRPRRRCGACPWVHQPRRHGSGQYTPHTPPSQRQSIHYLSTHTYTHIHTHRCSGDRAVSAGDESAEDSPPPPPLLPLLLPALVPRRSRLA